jgi:hypothetical protein
MQFLGVELGWVCEVIGGFLLGVFRGRKDHSLFFRG